MKKSEAKPEKVFMLIDSHALIHRAYHAMPFLQTKEGVPSGALFGLTNMILNAVEKFQPQYIFAANDLPKTTFREMAYKDYKAHRSATDDALVEQIVAQPKVYEAFGIPLLSLEGYEADDVIGTLVEKIQKKEKNYKIVILTGDMDIMQLVEDDKVVVYTGKKGEEDLIYNQEEVFNKHGLHPDQIPDYKGLRGDTSDNIPGIKGIGEKTAMQILSKGENLKNVYKLINKGKDKDFFGITERMFELLKNGEEDAMFSKELATINCEINIDIPKNEIYDLKENIPRLKHMCEEYNFLSIRRKLENMSRGPVVLDEFAKVEEKVEEWKDETVEAKPLVSPQESPANQVQFSEIGLKKAQIALWILNSAEGNADATRLQYLTKKNSEEEILKYLEAEIKKNGLEEIYYDIELPLIPILDSSNKVGIKVDREKLQELLAKYEKEKTILVHDIYKLAGREFNINSPKQMGEILFTEMKIQGEGKLKKTDGGKVSTRADVLEELRDVHPIVSKILDYRETEKMINTYLEPLLMHSTFDSRIHTTFVQTGSATGRFSSINPNMQNIPVKGEEGTELRKCFIADEGKVLIAADYSQIELRIAGILSGDEYLQEIFKTNQDIHTMIAVKMFNKKPDEITKDERNAAKAMNFGILYGMGVSSIKKTLKVERNVAQAFYDSYTMSVSGLIKYIKETISKAKEIGYTETLYGRQRQLKELFSNIPMIRAAGERAAMNAPIQGSNADIIKLAMVDFDKVCKIKKWVGATAGSTDGLDKVSPGHKATQENKVNFLLQIHDEILFEVDKKLVGEVSKELKRVMESVMEIHKPKITFTPIPILVNVKTGENWGDLA